MSSRGQTERSEDNWFFVRRARETRQIEHRRRYLASVLPDPEPQPVVEIDRQLSLLAVESSDEPTAA